MFLVRFRGYTELVFGLVDTYTLKITVVNKGENAFLAKMYVDFPDVLSAVGVQFVNVSYLMMYRINVQI